MLAGKRGAGVLTRSSEKNKRACNDGETRESLFSDVPLQDLDSLGYPFPPNDVVKTDRKKRKEKDVVKNRMILVNTFEQPFGDIYPKGVWSELRKRVSSNIFRNVVALASFHGGKRFFACSGFLIDFDDNCPTILTSASLVRSPDGQNRILEDLKIDVLLPNKQRREGTLRHCSLHYNVALVCIKDFRAVCPVNLKEALRLPRGSISSFHTRDVVAVGRFFKSGALMAASGTITNWRSTLDSHIVFHSSCKITKAGIGGPLVDVLGNFLGMNFYHPRVGTPCVFAHVLCGILEYFKTKNTKYKNRYGRESVVVEDETGGPNSWPVPKPRWCDPRELEEDGMDEYERRLRASGIRFGYSGGHILIYK